jgi:glutamine amidotransferase
MSTKTVVVDYGIGNVFSVCNALRAIGSDVSLTGSREEIRNADRVLLPGVGAFAKAMEALNRLGIADAVKEYASSGRPFLGICIGMQVLMERSHEFGVHAGLGLFHGEVLRVDDGLTSGTPRRVPHVGWAALEPPCPADQWARTPLAPLRPLADALYFVHSYHCAPANSAERSAVCVYDGTEITAAIRRDNIFGVQFHPERSGALGLQVLKAFVEL